MTSPTATIYFFEGIPEEISNVSLRRNRRTGVRSVLLAFSFVKFQASKSIGEIQQLYKTIY
jgi:photosystem II Psb28-2 protein